MPICVAVELFPNSLSFRVAASVDADVQAPVARHFNGRVTRSIGGHPVAIEWYLDGALHDPDRRTPAYVSLRQDGSVKQERHYRRGLLDDPSPGVPAVRGFYADGATKYVEHYRGGRRHDAADGTPAIRKWRLDGSLRAERRYADGRWSH